MEKKVTYTGSFVNDKEEGFGVKVDEIDLIGGNYAERHHKHTCTNEFFEGRPHGIEHSGERWCIMKDGRELFCRDFDLAKPTCEGYFDPYQMKWRFERTLKELQKAQKDYIEDVFGPDDY